MREADYKGSPAAHLICCNLCCVFHNPNLQSLISTGLSMALLTLSDISFGYTGPALFEGVSLQVQQGERVCLLGRNGAGKSTLFKLITGAFSPNTGVMATQKGTRVAQLAQDVPTGLVGSIREVVSAHVPVAAESGPPIVETILSRMKLDAEAEFSELSVGLQRRGLLARALATQPDVLLLDEPTNHLDIDAIAWLESFLLKRRGALLFITHDRMLTQRLATRIIEIEQGGVASWACDYTTYLRRKEQRLEAVEAGNKEFDRRLAEEEAWIRQGIKARRTRNEGRVRALLKMRNERRQRRERVGEVSITLQTTRMTTRHVIQAEEVCYGYEDDKPIVEGFSATIQRGDKVGLIGPNGSGKTTLLRLLLGELHPKSGSVRHGLRLQTAYFDQLREQLDDDDTVANNVAFGKDRVEFNGKTQHIFSYLEQFLFTREQAHSVVKTLSGGERNRLLLARLFTLPANVLALDEPTNDLDAESLEVLEATLVTYPGTVLVVSHDRTFLNNVATSTIAFEPDRIHEYVGGYDDWLRQRPELEARPRPQKKERAPRPKSGPRKLTFKEAKELDTIPHRIEELETLQKALHVKLSDPSVYKSGSGVRELTAELETVEAELEDALGRWEVLEEIREGGRTGRS